jgi:ferric-dicitrate binding protein FerR (iron transport regulator)
MQIDKYNLIIKILNDSATKVEEELFTYWLNESEYNKKEFEQIKKIWLAAKPKQIPDLPVIDFEWEKFFDKINAGNLKQQNKFSLLINDILKPKFKPAIAIITIILITSVLFLINEKSSKIKSQWKIFATSNKERTTIILPDSSIVKLNSSSTIEFNEPFGIEKREIKLRGEAFFSVKKDIRPFVISTENACVKVLGTKFDVWSRCNKTRVVVAEGRVNLSSKKIKNGVIVLTKNQLSEVAKNAAPSNSINVKAENYIGWIENRLVFNESSLGEIAGELERFFNIKISIADSALLKRTMTGSLNNVNADSALAIVCLALDLDYHKSRNEYVIEDKIELNN